MGKLHYWFHFHVHGLCHLMPSQLLVCLIRATMTTWTLKPIMAPGSGLRSGSSCVEGFLQIGSGCLQGLSMTYCNFEFNHEDPRQSSTSPGERNIAISLTCVLRKKNREIKPYEILRFCHNGRGDSFGEITLLCCSRVVLGSSSLLFCFWDGLQAELTLLSCWTSPRRPW